MTCPSVLTFSLSTATSLCTVTSTWTPGKASNDIITHSCSPQTTLHRATRGGFRIIDLVQGSLVSNPSVFPVDFLFRPVSFPTLPRAHSYWSSFSSFIEFYLRASTLAISCFSPPLPTCSFLFFSFWFLCMKWNTKYLSCSRYCVKSSEYRYGEDIVLAHRLSNLTGYWHEANNLQIIN